MDEDKTTARYGGLIDWMKAHLQRKRDDASDRYFKDLDRIAQEPFDSRIDSRLIEFSI